MCCCIVEHVRMRYVRRNRWWCIEKKYTNDMCYKGMSCNAMV